MSTAPHSQIALGTPGAKAVNFVVPGVPESNDAFLLTPAGLRPLAHKRVAGGMRVTLGEGEHGALVLLTQDPVVVTQLSRKATAAKARAAELQRALAAHSLTQVTALAQRLDATVLEPAPAGPSASGAAAASVNANRVNLAGTRTGTRQLLQTAAANLAAGDKLLAAGDQQSAAAQSRRVEQAVLQVLRHHWQLAAAGSSGTSMADPLAASMRTRNLLSENPFALSPLATPELPRLARELTAAPWRLASPSGGEFEALQPMLAAGWRHFQHPQGYLTSNVELSGDTPHGGAASLRLSAHWSDGGTDEQGVVETAPLWVTSPAVNVAAGELVWIQAWIRIAAPIRGSGDGLLVFDSLGGEPLAARVQQTAGWQEINLYRAAVRNDRVSVTLALCGAGEAWIDDVTIRVAPRAALPQQAARQPGVPQQFAPQQATTGRPWLR